MAKETTGEVDGKSRGSGLLKTLLWTGVAVGATALANAYIFYRTPPLTSALEGGEVRYFPTADGDVFYKKKGDGPPLLLVHSIGAGCSSYEFRHIWGALSEKHTVYALDLLGFGKSDKPAIAYTDAIYINLISDFCKKVIGVGDGRGEADVIATSLSAAYVIALSQRDPSLFHRLVLVCPTGIEELATPINAGSTAIQGALKAPVLGTAFYNGVTSKAYIRSYLEKRVFAHSAKVTPEMVDYYHTAAHQPGGENVLPYFLSGYLNVNVREAFKGVIDLPLLVWGRQAVQTPIGDSEEFIQSNPNAKLEVIEDAGCLPHDEQPEAFLTAARPFLAGPLTSEPATPSIPAAASSPAG
jgi:pimeloyl-ACP methyl ester carboxylesterase